jgi:hypothetical protein
MSSKLSLLLLVLASFTLSSCATHPPQASNTPAASKYNLGVIIFPEDELEARAFVDLLKNKKNQKETKLSTPKSFECQFFPGEPECKFNLSLSDRNFLVYRMGFPKIANDGFLVIYINKATAPQNGVWGYYSLDQHNTLKKAQLTWPEGLLAAPFITMKDSHKTFRFISGAESSFKKTEYIWDGSAFKSI